MMTKYMQCLFVAEIYYSLLICGVMSAAPLTDNEMHGYSVNTDLLASGDTVVGLNHAPNALTSTPNKEMQNNNSSSNSNSNSSSSSNINVLSNHICSREETYVEELKTPSMEPVRIRSSQWCLEFPPRCSNYKTEMRRTMKLQNVTKTRTIRFCCDGYAGNISINDTICKPVCRGGCGRGFCLKPDVCSCDAGYIGKHCTHRCDHDHWGDECKNLCRCQNGAVCDNKSGLCHCTSGWDGELCDKACPTGSYGVMCRKECDCRANNNNNNSSNQCHPQTGECLFNDADTGTALLPLVPPNLSDLQPTVNVTHVMIETLNSTIVNITHNLDRIAKNIGHVAPTTADPVTYLLPDLSIAGITTPHPVPEVIVIKQQNNEQHHGVPKIIVHQPGVDVGQAKAPDVIHVITNWQQQQNQQHHLLNGTDDGHNLNLAGLGVVNTAAAPNTIADHDSHLLTTLLIILLIIMTAIAIGFLYVYRRYHWQRARVEAVLAERNVVIGSGGGGGGGGGMGGGGVGVIGSRLGQPECTVTLVGESALTQGKSFLKPLPDLPAFTQMVCNKIEAPTYYDSPSSNNSSVKAASYSYARKESIYSVISPKSRKCSAESHLYDEIRYPSAAHHHHHEHHLHHQHLPQQHQLIQQQQHIPQQQFQQQQQQLQHLPHLEVPIQTMNYLQVPPQHPYKINHL